jgi:HD superfamily phosphohydrolase
MQIEDPVHGTGEIEKEVLKELLQTEPVQRLKEIHQAGPLPFFTDKYPVTRYQHTIGVFLLLRKHGASIEEQIAGLLHDVPHTAFSHTVDFVYKTEEHDYHDDFLEKMVYSSEIPEIVEKHGLDIEKILDESRFGLLEQDMPLLCADRIDYFLRDSQQVMGEDIDELRDSLTVHDGMFVLDDREIAEEFALRFIEADRSLWANPEEVAINELFADAVREALETGIIEEDDLFRTDEYVMDKLRDSGNEFIQERLEQLEEKSFTVGADDSDFTGHTKARYVDPPVLEDGETVRVSDYSETLRQEIDRHREEVEDGFPVRID